MIRVYKSAGFEYLYLVRKNNSACFATPFSRIETIFWPRQARDRHEEETLKTEAFDAGRSRLPRLAAAERPWLWYERVPPVCLAGDGCSKRNKRYG